MAKIIFYCEKACLGHLCILALRKIELCNHQRDEKKSKNHAPALNILSKSVLLTAVFGQRHLLHFKDLKLFNF